MFVDNLFSFIITRRKNKKRGEINSVIRSFVAQFGLKSRNFVDEALKERKKKTKMAKTNEKCNF